MEIADRLLDDSLLEFGTPEHGAALADEIETVFERLTAGGAEVVILVAPPNAEPVRRRTRPADMLHLADQLKMRPIDSTISRSSTSTRSCARGVRPAPRSSTD